MEVRRDVLLGLVSLMVFYLALSFAAVGLQQRLDPTVAVIEERNVDSIMSSLELLSLLQVEHDEAQGVRMQRLAKRLVQRVTEPGEDMLAARIVENVSRSLAGDMSVRPVLVSDLESLIAVNRQGMMSRADQAFRLAQGGIWVLSALGTIGVLAAWYIIRQLRGRIVLPLLRISQTMKQAREGKTFMRIYAGNAPNEIREIARALNALLDQRAQHFQRRLARQRGPERHVVAALIERVPHPTWVLDDQGDILAANQEGMDMQQGQRGRIIKSDLHAIADMHFRGQPHEEPLDEFDVVPLGESSQILCMLTRLPPLDA